MKTFKVLGSGCRNCEATASVIAQAAKEASIEIELEKVTVSCAALYGPHVSWYSGLTDSPFTQDIV
jgi:hypothetical protein